MEIIPIVVTVLFIGTAFLLCVIIFSFINKKIKSGSEPLSNQDNIHSRFEVNRFSSYCYNTNHILWSEEKTDSSEQRQNKSFVDSKNSFHIYYEPRITENPEVEPQIKILGRTGKFEVINNLTKDQTKAVNW